MQLPVNSIWKNTTARQFAGVVSGIDDVQTMQNFLRDVMTEREIIEISSRLEAAKMLKNGQKYTEITEKTKLSSRTVARISEWMREGCNGYEVALDMIDHPRHMPPARAE